MLNQLPSIPPVKREKTTVSTKPKNGFSEKYPVTAMKSKSPQSFEEKPTKLKHF